MAKKKARRPATDAGLTITSMMDMMTIILCFLLKSYQTEDVTVKANDDLQIPASSALKDVKASVSLVVTARQILVDGDIVVKLEQVQSDAGRTVAAVSDDDKKGELITDLYEKLLEKAEEAKEVGSNLRNRGVEEGGFEGKVLLQCDRRLPFSLIREVMYTAGQAQFSKFQFVVVKGGS